MIRRSPTRLELKLEDIQEFEFVQKTDRKKIILSCTGIEEAKKLIRQERIGYTGGPLAATHPRLPSTTSSSGFTTSTITPAPRRIHHSLTNVISSSRPRPSTSATTPTQLAPSPLGQEEDELIEDLADLMETPYTHPPPVSISQEEMLLELSHHVPPSETQELPDDNLDTEELPSEDE